MKLVRVLYLILNSQLGVEICNLFVITPCFVLQCCFEVLGYFSVDIYSYYYPITMILLFYKKDNGDGDDFTTPLKELISNERRNTKLAPVNKSPFVPRVINYTSKPTKEQLIIYNYVTEHARDE